MSRLHLSLAQARALHLAAQGLLAAPRKKAVKADVLAAIRRMGVLQIDTIHVVARSPYLVLWSRLGHYPQVWLEELLAEGDLYEYWAHEACFVPIEDYRLYRHRMLDPSAMGWKYSAQWMKDHRTEVGALEKHIRQNGPVRSADFKRTDGKSGGWWEWKPEKRSLEDHHPLAFRPGGMGPQTGAGAVQLRLPARMLYPGGQTPVRLLQLADFASGRAGRTAGRQSTPQ